MTEIVYLLVGMFIGAFIGLLAMVLVSVGCYERGAEDERAKLWQYRDDS